MNTKDRLSKFGEKLIDGFFLGYSVNSPNKRVFNKATRRVEEHLKLSAFATQTPLQEKDPIGYLLMTLFNSFNIPFDDVNDVLTMIYGRDNVSTSQDVPSTSSSDPIIVVPTNTEETNEKDDDVIEVVTEPVNPEDDATNDTDSTNLDTNITVEQIPVQRVHVNHPLDNILGDLSDGFRTRSQLNSSASASASTSTECFYIY